MVANRSLRDGVFSVQLTESFDGTSEVCTSEMQIEFAAEESAEATPTDPANLISRSLKGS